MRLPLVMLSGAKGNYTLDVCDKELSFHAVNGALARQALNKCTGADPFTWGKAEAEWQAAALARHQRFYSLYLSTMTEYIDDATKIALGGLHGLIGYVVGLLEDARADNRDTRAVFATLLEDARAGNRGTRPVFTIQRRMCQLLNCDREEIIYSRAIGNLHSYTTTAAVQRSAARIGAPDTFEDACRMATAALTTDRRVTTDATDAKCVTMDVQRVMHSLRPTNRMPTGLKINAGHDVLRALALALPSGETVTSATFVARVDDAAQIGVPCLVTEFFINGRVHKYCCHVPQITKHVDPKPKPNPEPAPEPVVAGAPTFRAEVIASAGGLCSVVPPAGISARVRGRGVQGFVPHTSKRGRAEPSTMAPAGGTMAPAGGVNKRGRSPHHPIQYLYAMSPTGRDFTRDEVRWFETNSVNASTIPAVLIPHDASAPFVPGRTISFVVGLAEYVVKVPAAHLGKADLVVSSSACEYRGCIV